MINAFHKAKILIRNDTGFKNAAGREIAPIVKMAEDVGCRLVSAVGQTDPESTKPYLLTLQFRDFDADWTVSEVYDIRKPEEKYTCAPQTTVINDKTVTVEAERYREVPALAFFPTEGGEAWTVGGESPSVANTDTC